MTWGVTVIGSEMKSADVVRLTPLVETTARSFSRSYPGVDEDDIAQEIWAHLVKHWDLFDGKEESYVLTAARKAATMYCKKEHLDYQVFSSQFIYTPNDVRALFREAFFESAEWEKAPGLEDHRLTVTDSNGVTVALWDLRSAFDQLSESDQVWIIRAYGSGEVLEKSQQRAAQRAVDRCTDILNKRIPQRKRTENFDLIERGARMTSTQAQHLTDKDYNS